MQDSNSSGAAAVNARTATSEGATIRGAHLPGALTAGLPEGRLALWEIERDLWAPLTHTVSAGGEVVAAALTAGRPHTAYRKIVDVVSRDVTEFHSVIESILAGIRSVTETVHPRKADTGSANSSFPTHGSSSGVSSSGVSSAGVSSAGGHDPSSSRRHSSAPDGSGSPPGGHDPSSGSHDSRPAPIVVKFEEHPRLAPLSAEHEASLTSLGFVREADPLPSVPSTRPDDSSYTRGWAKWIGAVPTRSVPYYGQTTDVTCGAVSALMSLEAEGLGGWGADGAANHSQELSFWRRATNLPACEPIGLAVTIANEITDSRLDLGRPSAILSTAEPVLLEDFTSQADEIRLRTQLQAESIVQAEALGLPVERRWTAVEEIRDRVSAGADVLLLISLDPLIGDPTPHWVLAHDVVPSGIIGDSLLISDPWVDAAHGETWVDTSALPIPLAGIDLVTRWGEPAYRGVVVVPRGEARS